jgi:hypothetical protein
VSPWRISIGVVVVALGSARPIFVAVSEEAGRCSYIRSVLSRLDGLRTAARLRESAAICDLLGHPGGEASRQRVDKITMSARRHLAEACVGFLQAVEVVITELLVHPLADKAVESRVFDESDRVVTQYVTSFDTIDDGALQLRE